METLHGDPELDALAEREQLIAARAATRAMLALRALGYDFVLVRICKVLTRGGECAAPGATSFECARRLLPALPREADGLRLIADKFDAEFRKGGTHEAERGYEEDASHRASEFEGGD
jgi:hypothetical protein